MIKILLSCAGGISTSLLATKMEKEAKDQGIECRISSTNQYGIEENSKDYDVIMVGPQVALSKAKEQAKGNAKVIAIDMYEYSNLDAKVVLDKALKAYNESN